MGVSKKTPPDRDQVLLVSLDTCAAHFGSEKDARNGKFSFRIVGWIEALKRLHIDSLRALAFAHGCACLPMSYKLCVRENEQRHEREHGKPFAPIEIRKLAVFSAQFDFRPPVPEMTPAMCEDDAFFVQLEFKTEKGIYEFFYRPHEARFEQLEGPLPPPRFGDEHLQELRPMMKSEHFEQLKRCKHRHRYLSAYTGKNYLKKSSPGATDALVRALIDADGKMLDKKRLS